MCAFTHGYRVAKLVSDAASDAGEVEPRPAAMRHTTHDVVVFDDDGAMKNLWGTAPKETWSECSEFSEAGSDELRVYGLDSQDS